MSLDAGTKIGPYEILTRIGAGGMGEVYKARDTRLSRTVAIKVLPQEGRRKPELQGRFEREARTIASLNHPHICTLYDVGEHDGSGYLVMEYLEGETLAERLERGPLPVPEVFKYAVEIADALDKAHREGITHRDLKPSNIMLTKSGAKLMDFGLAKIQQSAQPASALSALPTNAAITADGVILGTLQYMAPEQLEGKEADARSDIFAFGAIIYEMIAGKKAFEGKSQASLIAAILDRDPPPLSNLQPMTPPHLDHIIRRCLAKEPDQRWQTASDLRHELKWISEIPAEHPKSPTKADGALRISLWTAVLLVFLAGFAVWLFKPERGGGNTGMIRLTMPLPSGESSNLHVIERLGALGVGPPLALSPDGTRVVYATGARLYLRTLDNLDFKPVSGTEGAADPFFSPDSEWVGFFAQGKLKKIPVSGGAPQTLCDAPYGEGGTWGTDGMIYFAPSNISGLSKVSATGGAPQVITRLDRNKGEVSHRWPQILPDSNAVLFTVWRGPGYEEKSLEVFKLDNGERRAVVNAADTGHYVSPGYLIYAQAGGLMAMPFDVARLETRGAATPIGTQVAMSGEGASFAVSDAGVLAYVSGNYQYERRLVWVDRKGNVEPLPAPLRAYQNVSISPDGKFVATQTDGPKLTIWIYDFARTTLTPFTSGASSQAPVWTPDGKRIAYRLTRLGFRNIYWKAADGSGEEERLTASENVQSPSSWSPDGKWLATAENDPSSTFTIDAWIRPLGGDGKPQLFASGSAPHFSPDGRWIAYSSPESGRDEIYVRPFPGPGGRTQVSTDGGIEPVWSRNGKELFYISGEKTMAVDVETQPAFRAGSPRMLFAGQYLLSPNGVSGYDVSPDGKRFLKIQAANAEQTGFQINIVINWLQELRQRTR